MAGEPVHYRSRFCSCYLPQQSDPGTVRGGTSKQKALMGRITAGLSKSVNGYVLKDSPQPQVSVTLGLLNLKPAPWRLST